MVYVINNILVYLSTKKPTYPKTRGTRDPTHPRYLTSTSAWAHVPDPIPHTETPATRALHIAIESKFNTQAEDGSVEEMSKLIIKLRNECAVGDTANAKKKDKRLRARAYSCGRSGAWPGCDIFSFEIRGLAWLRSLC